MVAEGKGDGRSALVIGGAGQKGRWFADFFASQGFTTVVADPAVEDGPGTFRAWTDAGVDFDVIVVAAPLAVAGRILAQLAVLKPKGLIFDIGSLKSPLIDGLKEPSVHWLPGDVFASDVRTGHAPSVGTPPDFL